MFPVRWHLIEANNIKNHLKKTQLVNGMLTSWVFFKWFKEIRLCYVSVHMFTVHTVSSHWTQIVCFCSLIDSGSSIKIMIWMTELREREEGHWPPSVCSNALVWMCVCVGGSPHKHTQLRCVSAVCLCFTAHRMFKKAFLWRITSQHGSCSGLWPRGETAAHTRPSSTHTLCVS